MSLFQDIPKQQYSFIVFWRGYVVISWERGSVWSFFAAECHHERAACV